MRYPTHEKLSGNPIPISETALLKVGLTGGIASGKSTVGEMLVALGAHLLQADQLAHQLMEPGQPVYREVVEHFGKNILNSDGSINRQRLAAIAFAPAETGQGASRIQELNQIVHPTVIRRQNEWMRAMGRQDPSAIAILEAALLLEAKADQELDCIIVVTCKPEQRVERWARHMHVDMESARIEVERRMAAQWSDEAKVQAADYVIDNSGSIEETRHRVEEIYALLRRRLTA